MLSGTAMKPGDALRVKDKVLRTENTQNHSQITMVEAMTYAVKTYPPELVFALGTLSSEYEYSPSEAKAAVHTGFKNLILS